MQTVYDEPDYTFVDGDKLGPEAIDVRSKLRAE